MVLGYTRLHNPQILNKREVEASDELRQDWTYCANRIEHIRTKTAVQIRSHAQKFFQRSYANHFLNSSFLKLIWNRREIASIWPLDGHFYKVKLGVYKLFFTDGFSSIFCASFDDF